MTERSKNNMSRDRATRAGHRARQRAKVDRCRGRQHALSTTEPVDVTIGGLTGNDSIDVKLNPAWTAGVLARTTLRTGDSRTLEIVDLLDTPWRPIVISVGSLYSADYETSSPRRCRSSRASSSIVDPTSARQALTGRRGSLA